MRFRYLTVLLLVAAQTGVLVEGWGRFRMPRTKTSNKASAKVIAQVKNTAMKTICKAAAQFGCKTVLADHALATKQVLSACEIAVKNCKRSAEYGPEYVLVPFSPNFSDYDDNNDKLITYKEFVASIMRSIPLADPDDLQKPFIFADANNDDVLEMDEFETAPFVWAPGDRDKVAAPPFVAGRRPTPPTGDNSVKHGHAV